MIDEKPIERASCKNQRENKRKWKLIARIILIYIIISMKISDKVCRLRGVNCVVIRVHPFQYREIVQNLLYENKFHIFEIISLTFSKILIQERERSGSSYNIGIEHDLPSVCNSIFFSQFVYPFKNVSPSLSEEANSPLYHG